MVLNIADCFYILSVLLSFYSVSSKAIGQTTRVYYPGLALSHYQSMGKEDLLS